MGDMIEPKGYQYWYIDPKAEKWCIKDDAPEWAKEEFAEYFNDELDEN
ncbi:MAG: hypothetical protein J6D02_09320 [Lachnospira sp.]|nr:hypothetical protein [Lachnospira sp.]